jgi:hypothetical protein
MMGGHRHMLVKSGPVLNTGNSLLTATEAFKSPRPLLGDHKRNDDVPDIDYIGGSRDSKG